MCVCKTELTFDDKKVIRVIFVNRGQFDITCDAFYMKHRNRIPHKAHALHLRQHKCVTHRHTATTPFFGI